MSDSSIPWPRKGDQLFKGDADWWNNACLNYHADHWDSYALGYKRAGDLVVEHVKKTRSKQDTLVYPVVFLYRQYIELRLKELIRNGNMLLDRPPEFPKRHNLEELWRETRKIMEQVCPEEPSEPFDAVEEAIQQFSETDPSSMAFRYPIDKNGRPFLPGLKHVNLRNVSEVVDRIGAFLDAASTCFSEYLDGKCEMETGLMW